MLAVEVDTGAPRNSREAKESYEQLLFELEMFSPGAIIEKPEASAIAEHRFVAEVTGFLIAGVKLGVFSGIVGICKTWLKSRPKAELTLRGKDGSEIRITNATPEQAIELFAKQNAIN